MVDRQGGIEAGGTRFVLAVGTPDRLEERAVIPTTTPAETLARCAEWLRQRRVSAVGVACFGPLARDERGFLGLARTPKPGWSEAPVRTVLEEALGVPVTVDTDVNAAALAEHRALGGDPLVYVTVGTGIGGGAIVGGGLLRGWPHPEMGHVPVARVDGDDFEGACPFHGACLEGMASGVAMARRWGRPAEDLPDDHPAWALEATYLAQGLAAVALVLAPRRIVVGGGIGRRPGVLDRVREAFALRQGSYLDAPEDLVVPPALGEDAGITGALMLAG